MSHTNYHCPICFEQLTESPPPPAPRRAHFCPDCGTAWIISQTLYRKPPVKSPLTGYSWWRTVADTLWLCWLTATNPRLAWQINGQSKWRYYCLMRITKDEQQ